MTYNIVQVSLRCTMRWILSPPFGFTGSSLLCGLSLVAGSWGYSLLWCLVFSLRWLLLWWSTGSVALTHGLWLTSACGVFLDQGLSPCPLHWQVDYLVTVPPGKSSNMLIRYTSLLQHDCHHSLSEQLHYITESSFLFLW